MADKKEEPIVTTDNPTPNARFQRFTGRVHPLVIVGIASVVLTALIIRASASPVGYASFEFEEAEDLSGGTTLGADSNASDGQFLAFAEDGSGTPADTGNTDPNPAPSDPPQDNSDDPTPDPSIPPIADNTGDLGTLIRNYPNGGVVTVPNGTYRVSDVRDYNPSNPLVLVAETEGGVDVVRASNQLGQTDQLLERVSNVTFVGIDFVDVMVAMYDTDNINFYHTTHTYPAQKSPEPRIKVCGSQQDPTTILIRGSRNIGIYGATIDEVGHDGIKLGSSRDIDIVGTSITDVHHDSYQTQTTAANARTCGHAADDPYHHSDAIQISPGGIENLMIKDTFSDGRHVWQVEGNNGTSIENVVVEDSVLYNNKTLRDQQGKIRGVVLDTRVKKSARNAASSGVEINMRNVKTYHNATSRASQHIWTNNAYAGSMKISKSNTQHIQGKPNTNPGLEWQKQNTFDEWQCFVSDVLGYNQYRGFCDGSAPDGADPAPAPTPDPTPDPGSDSGSATGPKKRADYPNATNTGFRASGLAQSQLNNSGKPTKWVIKANGTVVDRVFHKGFIVVDADNVTIKNSMVVGSTSKVIQNNGNNLRIENSLIRGGALRSGLKIPSPCDAAIGSSNYTAVRVDVSNCADGFKISGNVTILDSYIHDLYADRRSGGSGTHNDGIQQNNTASMQQLIFRGNSVYLHPCTSNRAFQLGLKSANRYGNYLIENNFFWGSIGVINATAKDGSSGGGTATIRNNLIAGTRTRGPFSDNGRADSQSIGLYTGALKKSISGNRFEDGTSADVSKYKPYTCDPNYN